MDTGSCTAARVTSHLLRTPGWSRKPGAARLPGGLYALKPASDDLLPLARLLLQRDN